MISHRYKCIFIHIPKCAGTSIEQALGHYDNKIPRDGQDHRSIRMIERPIKLKYLANIDNFKAIARSIQHNFRNHANPNNGNTVTKEQYASYFKFVIVRNPWARVYSWYRNVMADEIHQENLNVNNSIDFNAFLKRFVGTGLLMPQTYWIKDFSGSIALDYIGRFETLNEDFEQVCELMKLDSISLPHKIKGSGKDYRQFYNDELIKLVSDVYREEIELFNYSFDK